MIRIQGLYEPSTRAALLVAAPTAKGSGTAIPSTLRRVLAAIRRLRRV